MNSSKRWMSALLIAAGALNARGAIEVDVPAAAPQPQPPAAAPAPAPVAAPPAAAPAPAAVRPVIVVPPPVTGAASNAPAASSAARRDDQLVLMNGDSLHGVLDSVDTAGALKWIHPSARQPIEFDLKSPLEIRLATRPAPESRAQSGVVWLTNGDSLAGDIVSMDAQVLELDTWYAGRLKIRRAMIRSLVPTGSAGGLVFEGPTGMDGWVSSADKIPPNSWTFREGALVSGRLNMPIGRQLPELPDAVSIQFDFNWQNYPFLMCMFLSENPKETSGNGYRLQISGSSIRLYRQSPQTGSRIIASSEIPNFTNDDNKKSARLHFLVDRSKKKVALMINNQLTGEWTDNMGTPPTGTCLVFQPQSGEASRISGIVVRKWDGRMPKAEDKIDTLEADMLRFINSDTLSGTVTGIATGKLNLETAYAPMSIPLERIQDIALRTKGQETPRRNKNDVRLHFQEKGSLTLELSRLRDGKVEGQSESMGSVAAPVGAFRRVEFNLYDEAREKVDSSGDAAGPAGARGQIRIIQGGVNQQIMIE